MSCLFQTIVCFLCLLTASSSGWGSETDHSSQVANQLESQAVEFIDNDRMTEGMALMKQALDIDPTPMRHMNYGSILFGNGVIDYKNGNKVVALKILYEAQDHLAQAIVGFHPHRDAIFIAHAYFLLGEMYLNALDNPEKAKVFYQKSLSYSPNQAAKEALKKIQ